VADIRDTIEAHNANGYFLATSSYLTIDLTGHLERMRNEKKYYVDWWTKTEIGERLRKYPHVSNIYRGILKMIKTPPNRSLLKEEKTK